MSEPQYQNKTHCCPEKILQDQESRVPVLQPTKQLSPPPFQLKVTPPVLQNDSCGQAPAVFPGSNSACHFQAPPARRTFTAFPIQRETNRKEGGEEAAGAEADAQTLYDAMEGWGTDEAVIFRTLEGKSPAHLKRVREIYYSRYGARLESDLQGDLGTTDFKRAMTSLLPALPFYNRLLLYKGTLDDNEGAMLELVKTANKEALDDARSDPKVRSFLQDELDPRSLYEAKKIIWENQMLDHVVELGKNAESFWGDDEEAVFMAVLDLSPSDRKTLWESHRQIFSYLEGYVTDESLIPAASEYGRLRTMCLGTEVEMLKAGMEAATEGMGTFDDLVAKVVAKTGSAAGMEDQLKLMLATGKNPEGGALTEEETEQIKMQLEQLGSVRNDLLKTQGETGVSVENKFLENLKGDVSQGEYESFSGQMGLTPLQQAKQRILDARGVFNDDEDAVYKAIESVPPDQRKALFSDPEVSSELSDFMGSASEQAALGALRENDTYKISLRKISEADGFWGQDEASLFRVLMGLSREDRARMQRQWPPELATIYSNLNDLEREAVDEILKTGRLSMEKGLRWATEGGGTDEDFLNETLERATAGERLLLRIGYAHANGMEIPATLVPPDMLAQAKAKYQKIMGFLGNDELTEDEIQAALDKLVGAPTPEEYRSPEGRRLTMYVLNQRVKDKGALRNGGFGDWFVGIFSDTPEISDVAEIAARSHFEQSADKKEISDEELAVMGYLEREFGIKYGEYVATVDMVAEIASTVAAVAAAVAVTVATGGAGAPTIALALSSSGLSASAATATAVAIQATAAALAAGTAKTGVAEAVGGEHYDLGQEGGKDFLIGGVEGAMTALTAGVAKALQARFFSLVGLKGGQLTSELSLAVLGSAEASLGKQIATGGIRAAIEGALGGAAGEMVLTALDEETWRKGLWDTVVKFGAAFLRGAALGGATGLVAGGAMEGFSLVLGRKEASRLLLKLEKAGLKAEDLKLLNLSQAQRYAEIHKLVEEGNLESAKKLFGELKKSFDPEYSAKLERGLFVKAAKDLDYSQFDIPAVMQHIKFRDHTVHRSKGIGGCHDAVEWAKIRQVDEGGFTMPVGKGIDEVPEAVITSVVPHDKVPGVMVVRYKIPALDRELKTTGALKLVEPKTIFDPSIWTDAKLETALKEALFDAMDKNGGVLKDGLFDGVTKSGYKIRGYIREGKISTFYFE